LVLQHKKHFSFSLVHFFTTLVVPNFSAAAPPQRGNLWLGTKQILSSLLAGKLLVVCAGNAW
jgi:hypothetical protein